MNDDIARRFVGETADHHMYVARDDGLYRHLQFRNSRYCNDGEWRVNTGYYWFDLITWPGTLVINGDCGTYTFSRVTDMFEFFRGHRINPQYWAEKVRGDTRTKVYSEEKFRRQVKQDAADAEEGYAGLSAAIEERFYGVLAEWDVTYEDGARRALNEFRFVPEGALCPQCSEDDAPVVLVREWRYSDTLVCPQGCGTRVEPFEFFDTWEWDLSEWDWTFLWCLHAIVWGIARYDGEEAPAFEPDPVRTTPVSAVITLRPAPRAVTVATTGGVL
jgi:hypothetical protein